MSDNEDANESGKHDITFTEQDQKFNKTDMDQDEEVDHRVHFQVMESEEEHYSFVAKPSRPKPKSYQNKLHSNKNRRSSTVWNQFTIRDSHKCIASCNICGMKLSFKSTVSNLRNHLKRKHDTESLSRPLRTKYQERPRAFQKKKNLTELGGLEGLILNVVGEEEDPLNTEDDEEVVEETVIYSPEAAEVDNQIEEGTPRSSTFRKSQEYKSQSTTHKVYSSDDNLKRSRLLDLQLECLEMKRYTMQMEALMLEQQLNLPRSLYTKPLREVDVYSRGTQTDVGGDKTKVFYVTDKAGDSQGAHIFQFRATSSE